jgi:hypothetical protein
MVDQKQRRHHDYDEANEASTHGNVQWSVTVVVTMIFNLIFVRAMSAPAAMHTIYRVRDGVGVIVLLAGVRCRREPEIQSPADTDAVDVNKFCHILVTRFCNKRDAVAKRNDADEKEAEVDHHCQERHRPHTDQGRAKTREAAFHQCKITI